MDNEEAELERALAGIANGGMSMDDDDFQEEGEKHEEPKAEVEAPKNEEKQKMEIKAPAPSGDLNRVKNDVLADLRPIIGSVKLPADEKFELTMRVYDVTKDGGMLEVAYEATKGIADDSKKADSLLRVINEIDKTA
ncbi:hypothetical protein FWG76_00230 [Candidatus Saccharibacteria bacterium]|nr:hypothetical protein [Candidatus Saccharibacteria bacterium]